MTLSVEELFQTGIIRKPRGLKGELKVEVVTDFPETFLTRKRYYVGCSPEAVAVYLVRSVVLAAPFVWFFFDGIDSLEKAQKLVGANLYVTAAELVEQPPGRAYRHEIIGMTVLDRQRQVIGVVRDVLSMPAHEVYEVQAGERKILLPAIEEFVESFNLVDRTIVVPRYAEFF